MTIIQNEKRIFGIDLMQTFAIAMVLFAQFILIFPQTNAIVLQVASLLHYLGLEVFFISSGYVLGKIIYAVFEKDDFGFKAVVQFLKRRFFQIYPLYFLIVCINILITFLVGYHIKESWSYFLFLQNFTTPNPTFFSESWVISVIVFASVLLPFLLLIFNTFFKNNNKSKAFLITTIFLITTFLFTKWIYNSSTSNTNINQWDVALKSVVIYRLDAVFIGVLFYWLQIKFPLFWKKSKMIIAFIGCLGVTFICLGVGYFRLLIENYPLFWNVFYLPITSLSVAFFLPFLTEFKNEFHRIKNLVTFISSMSYSIYLLHFGVVFQLLNYYFPIVLLPVKERLVFVFSYLFLTITLSYFLKNHYQKPIYNKFTKRS